MSDLHFTGVFPILVTPFNDNEHIDLTSFERVVDFMAQLGVDGVTILGVLGESNRLIDAEREALMASASAHGSPKRVSFVTPQTSLAARHQRAGSRRCSRLDILA